MATYTCSFKETEYPNKSTWTLSIDYPQFNIKASGATFEIPGVKISAKYVYAGKTHAKLTYTNGLPTYVAKEGADHSSMEYGMYTCYSKIHGDSYDGWDVTPWASGESKILPVESNSRATKTTNRWFNENNKTTRTINLYLDELGDYIGAESYGDWRWNSANAQYIPELQGYRPTNSGWQKYEPNIIIGTVTLEAPPTFEATDLYYDGTSLFTGLSRVYCDISDCTALYGGDIESVVLKVGNQSATISGDGTVYIDLAVAGTFTPTVTVTDSRGQITTKTLSPIVVKSYHSPLASVTLDRMDSSGAVADEGQYALITADITYVDELGALSEPIVKVDGVVTTAEWYSDRSLTTQITNWSEYHPNSPVRLYGKVGTFSTEQSYQIGVTPVDTMSSGAEIIQSLATAFYTIDFLAGGHGIAFGQPATQDGFFCNMDSYFKDHANIVRALFDFIHPVGSYYETSDTSFNPNTTWGGTWELEAEGLVHIGAGSTYSAGDTGGEATHTLTIDEMPSHGHIPNDWIVVANTNYVHAGDNIASSSSGPFSTKKYAKPNRDNYISNNTGGGQAHNNMQPYIVVNRWHRTA